MNKLYKKYINSYDEATRIRGQWNINAGPESQQVITKNERVFTSIVDGKVDVNIGGIDHFTEHTVVFKDGTEQEIDTIVCCTGFEFSVPFLELSTSNPRELYKHMITPEYRESLALIGFVRPQQGGIPGMAELQARYFALLCSGEVELIEQEALEDQIAEDKARWEHAFRVTPHISSLVNYAHYCEDLARLIGCEFDVQPSDEELYAKCVYGPLWGIQYRLRGPGARPEKAREIILEKTPEPFPRPHKLKIKALELLIKGRELVGASSDLLPRTL